MLNYQTFGETSSHPDLLIAHGLFGSGRNWRAIARNLASDRRVVTVDMRNHGDSFWDDNNSYEAMSDDLAQVVESQDAPMDILGHSMGGKAAIVLALSHPKLVNRLVVADIAPTAYQHDQVSNVNIMQSLSLDSFTRRTEADAILASQLPDAAVRSFFLQSLVISEQGNSWQLNLNALGENMDKIVGFPNVTGAFEGQTLFLRGGASPYVQDKDISRIAELFPNYTLETLEGAGHWLHAEATRAFIGAVKAFLG